jgi:hypothetical protein
MNAFYNGASSEDSNACGRLAPGKRRSSVLLASGGLERHIENPEDKFIRIVKLE